MDTLAHGLGFWDTVGVTGVALYVIAYSGVQAGRIDGNGGLYCAMNGAAALFILLSTIGAFNLSAALVNGLFLAVSLWGALRLWREARLRRRRLLAEQAVAGRIAAIEAEVARIPLHHAGRRRRRRYVIRKGRTSQHA